MSWLPILLVAFLCFAVAVIVLRLPRAGWMLFGSAMLFGLAGYAVQGHPGLAGAPKPAPEVSTAGETLLVDARRGFFGKDSVPSRYVVIADGFARKGQYQNAAGILEHALAENPKDGEAWLAQANALVEHADGNLTPAANYAFQQAEIAAPGNPGPAYFRGIALLRGGQVREAEALWAQTLRNAPDDAPWKPEFQAQFERLEALIARLEGQ